MLVTFSHTVGHTVGHTVVVTANMNREGVTIVSSERYSREITLFSSRGVSPLSHQFVTLKGAGHTVGHTVCHTVGPDPQRPVTLGTLNPQVKSVAPLAFIHTLGNVLTNISLGLVAVSFTHTVKVGFVLRGGREGEG